MTTVTTPTNEKPPLDLVFLDVETTGLDPQKHEILEVAAIRVTHDLSRILDKFCTKVRPTRLHDADPAALEVNGYSDAEWADAIDLDEALTVLWPILEGAVPAGHNVGFDLRFLEAAAHTTGRATETSALPTDYHRLDTASLAWLLITTGQSSRWNLDATCAALGIVQERKHRALDDVRAALQVARVVRERWLHPVMLVSDDAGASDLSLATGDDAVMRPATPHPRIVGSGPGMRFGGDV
ncbi:MAG: 3'-5' exonuclease [Myxococcota bacterium]|nr:3'-5' exonuclease [Myxococcota bacterium]